MAERAGHEIPNLDVAGSNPISIKVLLIQGLFLFFSISLYEAVFCRVLACVCEAQLQICVIFVFAFREKLGAPWTIVTV